MSTTLRIFLDNLSASYFPGQVISGKLVMDLPKEKKTKGLKLACSGKALVRWTTSGKNSIKHQQATEDYFYYETYFVGSAVNGILDLNTHPGANQPGELVTSKYLGCCCWKSGPITLTARLGKTGFVSGEPMHFVAEVNNLSKKELGGIHLRVTSHVTLNTVSGHLSRKPEIVAEVDLVGTVRPGGSESFRSSELILPALPASNLAGGNLISLDYQLEIKLNLPSGHFNLEGSIPIIIGNIPFRNFFVQLTRPEPAAYGSIPSAQPVPGYPDLPPPTFVALGKVPGKGYFEAGGVTDFSTNNGEAVLEKDFVLKFASYGFGWTQY